MARKTCKGHVAAKKKVFFFERENIECFVQGDALLKHTNGVRAKLN